jgi:thiosulfate/3-mercaptopyruvate sulfurtransferase
MTKQYPYGQGPVKWVSTDWLKDHLNDASLMILDVQPDPHDYLKEHIPGSRYMSERLWRVPDKGVPGQYIPRAAAQIIVRRVGLVPDTPVVVYTGVGPVKGWGDGLEQTMMAYSLARFGHNNVYVLDGGIEKWKAEGRPLTQKYPKVKPSKFSAVVREEYFVQYREFKTIKDGDGVFLLDARPSAAYQGQGPWIKPGHIPGAVNLPWSGLMDPGNTRLLKPDHEIQAMLDQIGLTREKTVICSCGTGREATNEFVLLKFYLGFPNVRIYEGSFTEWVSHPRNPTVTGPNPR